MEDIEKCMMNHTKTVSTGTNQVNKYLPNNQTQSVQRKRRMTGFIDNSSQNVDFKVSRMQVNGKDKLERNKSQLGSDITIDLTKQNTEVTDSVVCENKQLKGTSSIARNMERGISKIAKKVTQ